MICSLIEQCGSYRTLACPYCLCYFLYTWFMIRIHGSFLQTLGIFHYPDLKTVLSIFQTLTVNNLSLEGVELFINHYWRQKENKNLDQCSGFFLWLSVYQPQIDKSDNIPSSHLPPREGKTRRLSLSRPSSREGSRPSSRGAPSRPLASTGCDRAVLHPSSSQPTSGGQTASINVFAQLNAMVQFILMRNVS